MHNIEPFYNWEKFYNIESDKKSPFFGRIYSLHYEHDIYGYYIHPQWDSIGSDTLFIKILFVDYKKKFAIIELFGEWNDALHNDIMQLKRVVIDRLSKNGINQFILMGENVFNFHASDDCYYEEWFEDVEDGWIACLNFRDFVEGEWTKFKLDFYLNFGKNLYIDDWRTYTPQNLYTRVNEMIKKRLGN
jgi:hypothetical protein